MGQLSFLRLSAGTMPSFCKRSQSHGRRLKMLTGLGLCTWLLQRQRPLFLTQGWIINFFFGFHQSSSFAQEEELLGSQGLQPDILASDFFFFTGKTLTQKMDLSALFALVSRGWQFQEILSGNAAAEGAAEPHLCVFVPVPHSPGHWALHVKGRASPRNIPTRINGWHWMSINDIPLSLLTNNPNSLSESPQQ